MQRKIKFVTLTVTAVLTFAALSITLGQRDHGQWKDHRFGHHHCDDRGSKSDTTKIGTKQL